MAAAQEIEKLLLLPDARPLSLETVSAAITDSSYFNPFDAIDASLRRLGTDYVDLYQAHQYDPTTPIDETLEALDAVVRSGKARYVGCSNYAAYQSERSPRL